MFKSYWAHHFIDSSISAKKHREPLPCPSWHPQPEHHLKHCLFSLGRIPVQQHSISKDATEEFAGMELFVPGFEGERKRSTRPAMRVLTAGTARAYIHDLMPPRPLSGRQLYSRDPIYTSYTFTNINYTFFTDVLFL